MVGLDLSSPHFCFFIRGLLSLAYPKGIFVNHSGWEEAGES